MLSDAETTERRRANDNPWYCLATMYGEQPLEGWDAKLADKNRAAWNQWVALSFDLNILRDLHERGVPAEELKVFSSEEEVEFFASRSGRSNEKPPDPNKPFDFSFTNFDRPVSFDGYLFKNAVFDGAMFSARVRFNSVIFFNLASFDAAKFYRTVSFNSAKFFGPINFINAHFNSRTLFRAANFINFVPDFRGATMHEATEWADTSWPFNWRDKPQAQD
jgi:hypothetical protein